MRIVSVAYKFSTAAQDILRQSLNLLERIRFFEDSSTRSDIFRLTRSMRFRISICFPGLGPAHLLKAFSALVALSCMPVETHVYGIRRSSCVFFRRGRGGRRSLLGARGQCVGNAGGRACLISNPTYFLPIFNDTNIC